MPTSKLACSLSFLTIALFSTPSVHCADDVFKSTRESLDLKSSLDRAFRSNPHLLEAQKELAIAKAHSSEAKSLFYPKVNLNLNYVRYRNDTLGLTMPELGSTLLEPAYVDPGNATKGTVEESVYLGRMGFVQTLYAGGRVRNTYRMSMATIKRAESDLETLRRQVEFETTKAFLALLSLREKDARIKVAVAELSRIEKLKSGNRLSQMALSRKKADLRKQLAQLSSESHAAKLNYLQAMGVELFNDVEVTGSLDLPVDLPDLQKILAWAKQNRSDIRQTELQAEVDQLSVNLSIAERYPVFLFGGSYEIREREFPLDDHNWNTGISMNIPIFDGFSNMSRIRASRARAEQGRLRKVQLEDQVEREVRSSYQEYVYWRDELGLRSNDLENLEKEKSSVANAGDALFRVDYAVWKMEAQLDVVEALTRLNLAKATLEKAVGRPLTAVQ